MLYWTPLVLLYLTISRSLCDRIENFESTIGSSTSKNSFFELLQLYVYNYLMIILGVDMSSIVNKEFQYNEAASFFSCNMQGSHLIERERVQTDSKLNSLLYRCFNHLEITRLSCSKIYKYNCRFVEQITNNLYIYMLPSNLFGKLTLNHSDVVLRTYLNTYAVTYSHVCTYPFTVFHVDISSFRNNSFHCVLIPFSDSNVQWSPLTAHTHTHKK